MTKKWILICALAAAAALAGGAWFWATHPPAYVTDTAKLIDHHFVVAAYTVTWVIQLSYLTWVGLKWCAQKQDAARLKHEGHSID
ncbi:MAG TPA: hypothetical protein VMA34_20365 [Terracidiphilus sp.]|nr:hypothetical protein [Terracidiphilus sp.]